MQRSKRKAKPGRYWTTYGGSGIYQIICSRHKQLNAALRAALECELEGGFKHRVYWVVEVRR